jgi:predicted ATPase/DNA-binding CsgD family transcriptional regulator
VSTPNNLPADLTSFVGREPQLAELRRLLRHARLITLTGPGGAGKTRLAVRLAAEQLTRHPDGVWLVDLSALGDDRLLEHTVASISGVKEEAKLPVIDALAKGLGGKHVLIVLDGCEHLVDSCAALASRLLGSCPELHILATSREPLGVPGEVIWRTPSLTIPRLEDAGHPELVLESEAIRLFVERARLSRPDFQLDGPASIALAQICTRLEGIPLAIELAAGLAGVMTLQEILERLRDRFRLLTGGNRGALPRHQTLRQAVDWSYGLLTPAEQALFARLALFTGGFDIAAAEAVAGGAPVEADQVLPILSRLVNKSLVVAEPARPQTTRYRMLDTIREYAFEKLQQGGDADWRNRHANYFLEWCRATSKELGSGEQLQALRRIDEEQANIRLALDWMLSEQPDGALQLAAAMGQYWFMRRHLSEGMQWLRRALEVESSSPNVRAAVLLSYARLSRRHGEYEATRKLAEECAALSRQLGLTSELARSLTLIGMVTSHSGDLTGAGPYFNESLELMRRGGDRLGIAGSLNNIALLTSAQGNHEAAQRMVQEAIEVAEGIGDRFAIAGVLDTVARIAIRLGGYAEARRDYMRALVISAELEDVMNVADCLDGMALIAQHDGEAARAVRLIAAAHQIRTSTGGETNPEWSLEVNEGLAAARARLKAHAADEAWQKGAALSMQDAVRFAIGETAEPLRDGSPLSDREKQVARLIADGLTNGEVAERLRIADRTVDAHVEHIRNKLGLRTRAQIAVWTHERLGSSPEGSTEIARKK